MLLPQNHSNHRPQLRQLRQRRALASYHMRHLPIASHLYLHFCLPSRPRLLSLCRLRWLSSMLPPTSSPPPPPLRPSRWLWVPTHLRIFKLLFLSRNVAVLPVPILHIPFTIPSHQPLPSLPLSVLIALLASPVRFSAPPRPLLRPRRLQLLGSPTTRLAIPEFCGAQLARRADRSDGGES